jgi:hypothetical protein
MFHVDTMAYLFEHHHPGKLKSIPWPVCEKCGLVYLRNPFTEWSIKNGCNSKEHPQYLQKRVLLVEQHQKLIAKK